jgi:glycosyltransferase involved in cell wall biosynthesis
MVKKKKVAIIGTNGIPASYGGFETLSEFLVENLNNQFEFIVFCSKGQKKKANNLKTYKGAKLIYLPFNANGYQSVIYDFISIIISLFRYDTLLVLGATGGISFVLNAFFKKNIILNHGGLNEWEREKYGKVGKMWALYSRKIATKFTTADIGDNPLIIESLFKTFGVKANLIAYGGDHVFKVETTDLLLQKYPFVADDYYVSVSRAQPDNNIHLLIDAFKLLPNNKVVIVSNWQVSDYGKELWESEKDKYSNVILVDAIYNKEELHFVRNKAQAYIHSHSFCGTAPSLVEAMSLDLPIISFDVPTNRYTTNNKAFYFKTSNDLIEIVKLLNNELLEKNKLEMSKLAVERYQWKHISNLYAKLF